MVRSRFPCERHLLDPEFRPCASNCGETYDSKKASAEIIRRAKEAMAPVQKVLADIRTQKKKKV